MKFSKNTSTPEAASPAYPVQSRPCLRYSKTSPISAGKIAV